MYILISFCNRERERNYPKIDLYLILKPAENSSSLKTINFPRQDNGFHGLDGTQTDGKT